MIRFTQCLHGCGTVSHALRGGGDRSMLAYESPFRPIVFWNLTRRCNLACDHCYISAGPGAGVDGELDPAAALAVVDDLARAGVPLILLSGGEPLLRPDLLAIAARARDRGVATVLSTNGTLIDTAVARQLLEAGVAYAGVSLDGATAATHDRIRGVPGAFDRAVAGIRACTGAGLRCGIRITLTRTNADELEPLLDLASELGVDRFCLYWLVPSGRGGAGHAGRQLDPAMVSTVLDRLYARADEIGGDRMEVLTVDAPSDAVALLDRMEARGAPSFPEARRLLMLQGGSCSAGRRVANIDPTGDVYPCQFAQAAEFRLGSVPATPFGELWEDSGNAVLAAFREKEGRIDGACGVCPDRAVCGGGCRVRAFRASGNLYGPDPFCTARREVG